MDATFKKLNYKDHPKVFILNHPESFNENLKSISLTSEIKTKIRKTDQIEFFIAFLTKQTEVDKLMPKVAPLLKGDVVFWIAYPKKSSKKYKADFDRDRGWEAVGEAEMEGVRIVAIDEDWSALRFRKVEYIKKLTRKFATLSKKGTEKVKKSTK